MSSTEGSRRFQADLYGPPIELPTDQVILADMVGRVMRDHHINIYPILAPETIQPDGSPVPKGKARIHLTGVHQHEETFHTLLAEIVSLRDKLREQSSEHREDNFELYNLIQAAAIKTLVRV